jgi:uncharacterized protein (DUF427 family)
VKAVLCGVVYFPPEDVRMEHLSLIVGPFKGGPGSWG